jgi:hypothetical protein
MKIYRPNRNINENQQKQSKIELRRPGRDLATASRRAGRYLAASWPLPGPALAETWLRAGHLAAVLSQPCRAWISDGPSGTKRSPCMGNAWEMYGKCMGNTWKGWPGLAWPGFGWPGLAWSGLGWPETNFLGGYFITSITEFPWEFPWNH